MRLLREQSGICYVGICAGVEIARELGIIPQISFCNDQQWRLSGICMDLMLEVVETGRQVQFHYENGPLMMLSDVERQKVMATFVTDAAQVFENQFRESQSNIKDDWICKQCFTQVKWHKSVDSAD